MERNLLSMPLVLALAVFVPGVVLGSEVGSYNAQNKYAESLYQDYSDASSGAVKFNISTLLSGSTAEFKAIGITQLIGLPTYELVAESSAVKIEQVKLGFVKKLDLSVKAELEGDRLSEFEEHGFPLSSGTYRILAVGVNIAGQQLTHKAIELCWDSQGKCFVVDYHVEYVDSIVNGIREEKARGYAMTITSDASLNKARCGLASDPSRSSKQLTWPAYSKEHKRVLRVMYRVNVGEVKLGMRCDASCAAQPWGEVKVSTGSSSGIFSTDCDDASNIARQGKTLRYVGKTGCAHKSTLNANFDLSVEGAGTLSSEITHSATGSVEQNGGIFTDTCAMFN